MHKYLTLIPLLLITACASKAPQTSKVEPHPDRDFSVICSSKEVMAGGWSKSEITPSMINALDPVIKTLNTSAKLSHIDKVYTQVVAGTNYAIEFTLSNGDTWHTLVYEDLQGNYSITVQATKGEMCLTPEIH